MKLDVEAGSSTLKQRDGSPEAHINDADYWSRFYARHSHSEPSAFCRYVLSSGYANPVIADIGSGDGRDSFDFGRSGRTVCGFELSTVGVRRCMLRAVALGMQDRVRFSVCDVSDAEAFGPALRQLLGGCETDRKPVTFYCRFFLHSVREEQEAAMLDTLFQVAKAGDYFAAEFRIEEDEHLRKVHHPHFRRYLNPGRFRAKLQTEYGCKLLVYQTGAGFSPYYGENPMLCRIIVALD